MNYPTVPDRGLISNGPTNGITSLKIDMNDTSIQTCVFCDIVAGKASAHVVAEDGLSLCILDIHPYAKGHCLVISKRHVPWWHELTDKENVSLFKLAKDVAGRMMDKLNPDFVFLYARGRRIPHTHLFLIPTYSGDVLDRFFNALENFQESPPMLAMLREPDAMAEAAALLSKT
jgi:histidine triad (HIT) family protein